MDLLQESKKSDKTAFNSLIEKYNTIFYKLARLYFYTDDEIKPLLSKSFIRLYTDIVNAKTERDFLILGIKIIIQDFQKEKISHKERHMTLTDLSISIGDKITSSKVNNAIVEYQTYRKASCVEEYLSSIKEEWRLSAFLYYYANLTIPEISSILKVSESSLNKDFEQIRIKIYEMIKNKEVDL